jgi:accessory gene regulator B
MEKFISQQSRWLAQGAGLNSTQEEIIKYSITVLSTTVFGYLAISLVGMLIGFPVLSLVAVFSTSLLRMFTGGAHASTPLRCVLIGAVIFPALGWISSFIPLYSLAYLFILTVIAGTLLIGQYAPADTPGKPIESKIKRRTLKMISFSLLYIWTGFMWYLLAQGKITSFFTASVLGILWQVFSITPWGYRILETFEAFINLIVKTTTSK